MTTSPSAPSHQPGSAAGRAWAQAFARWILGLMFLMAGLYKCFQLGAIQHARQFFVQPYADTILPVWALWLTGVLVPWIELGAGLLLLIGYARKAALLALGGVLVLVTFGHLLAQPLYALHEHVIPRTALLLFLLSVPDEDRLSLDAWLAGRRGRRT